jgi:isoleucyl-tRNA synthetase
MSKSKMNYPDPMLLIEKYGVDSLRLYLMSSPVMKSENLNFAEKEVADIRRKVFVIWWNVLGFYETFGQPNQAITAPESVPENPLDQWLLSAVTELITTVTADFEAYDLVRASRSLMEFVDVLSTWYLRLSRDRIKDPTQPETTQVFGYAIYTLAQLFAPITPFFADLVHQSLVSADSSIHLTDWPTAQAQLLKPTLNADMQIVRKLVESAHGERKNQGLKVRQPLASVTLTVALLLENAAALNQVIEAELNVKKVIWQVGPVDQAPVFDTVLTPELRAEGEARDLMRQIQNLRKTAGLKAGQMAKATVPSWPEAWKAEIERKTSVTLVEGPELKLI